MITDDARVVLGIPRDRHGQFDPAQTPKYGRRFPGFDDKILALCAHGISIGSIRSPVGGLYNVEVSANLVSAKLR